ncbi:MAG TPA: AMP-binding protein [Bryobacteraceae bacterium]|nr:AMP-binding protein [Bryobacteraceae bacterium]
MADSRQNLASLVDDFERHRSDIAIQAPRGLRQTRTTYAELASLARRFAAELELRQIGKGERVLLWGENSAEWVAAFFGCVLRGVLPVPLDAAGSREFAARVVTEVAPRLIVADRERAEQINATLVLEELPRSLTARKATALENLVPDDPLQVIFTSGTTGEPKGIVHTHANVLASIAPIEREMQKYLRYERFFHPIRFLHTLPLSHVFGQFMGLWIPPLLAAEVHYQNRLVASELAVQIHRDRISVLATVPRVVEMMRSYLRERFADLDQRQQTAGHLKAWQRWWHFRDVHRLLGFKFWAFISGGAALPPETEQFWNSLGFVVVQGYGMTETTALVTLNHPFKPAQGTIGQVLPGREVKLSEEGEVLVKGSSISNITWQNGRAHRTGDEWLHTGDLAEFDEAGNLRFRGRKKDVIVTAAGLNIYPEDLEQALARQPAIKTAAVIESDSGNGPEPVAVIVAADPVRIDEAVENANRELASFQQIRRWLIWPDPDLPRTSTGKVLRREIVRRMAAGDAASEARGGADLNLDSLGRVELQAKLEQQYGIVLDDAALQEVKTKADLDQLVRTAPAGERRDPHLYLHWPWHPLQQLIRAAFINAIAMPFVWFLATPRVRCNSEPLSGPLLLAANHLTSYDAAFVLYALPVRLRSRVAIAMSGEMLLDMRRARNQGNWFLNLLGPVAYFLITALFNVFPLPQRSGFRRSFQHAGEAIDRGYSVLVFPEGHRSEDGNPQPFRTGSGLLWKELGVTALPVFIAGLGELKAKGGRWFRSGKIEVRTGEPLQLEPHRSPEELTETLRQGVFGLLDERSSAIQTAESPIKD